MKHKNKRPAPLRCHCGSGTVIRKASEIYDHVTNGDEYVITCARYPACDSYVGVHRGTLRPKGTLAGGELRHWRIIAHKAFDAIWENNIMSRTGAYHWICDKFGLDKQHGHIGFFSAYMCEQLIQECVKVLDGNNVPLPSALSRDKLLTKKAA